MNEERMVLFNVYCSKCKHYQVAEEDEPCRECLKHPTNIHSYKPINYEEGENKGRKIPHKKV